MIKCCFVNTHERSGGAAISAWRLFEAVHKFLPQSRYLVSRKSSELEQVIIAHDSLAYLKPRVRSRQERAYTKLNSGRSSSLFSTARFKSKSVIKKINALNPDIVHLHWISDGFLAIEDLQHIDAPLVWTLHDQWAFTGGCHYSANCSRWMGACGNCPKLARSNVHDLSYSVFARKTINWPKLDLNIVVPSNWLAGLAKQSPLLRDFPIQVIPYGLDLSLYDVQEKSTARQILKLPLDKSLVLFGACNATVDPNKGFDLLIEGLNHLSGTAKKQIELVVFGNGDSKLQNELDFRIHFLGNIQDEQKLAKIYAASDVFVAPSREDNLPNTCIEAMACGTPVVAFDIGGMPDIISHQQTGFLVDAYNTEQLAVGIRWVINALEGSKGLQLAARSDAEKKYSPATNAGHYIDLYKNLLSTK